MATIITTCHALVKRGILQHKHIPTLWSDHHLFPPKWHNAMLQLLHDCEVLYPISNDKSLVPSLLPKWEDRKTNDPWSRSVPISKRNYWFQIEIDFLLAHSSDLSSEGAPLSPGIIPRLICRVAKMYELCKSWRSGLICRHKSHLIRISLCALTPPLALFPTIPKPHPKMKCLLLEVRSLFVSKMVDYRCAQFLRGVVGIIQNLLTDFYHMSYCVTSPCQGKDCFFLHKDIGPSSLVDLQVKCSQGSHFESVVRIAPELIFIDSHLRSCFLIDWPKNIDDSKLDLIGTGGYGKVFRGNLRSDQFQSKTWTPVAIKMAFDGDDEGSAPGGTSVGNSGGGKFKKEKSVKRFQEFQREAWIITRILFASLDSVSLHWLSSLNL